MKFDIKDLPYAQFEQLGMSKKDVITMNHQQLADLLNGGRTGLVTLILPLGEGMIPIKADVKLSLIRNPDNTVSLGIHPILAEAKNTIGATPEQWDKMLKGEPIIKNAKALNGNIEPHIFQLDKQTNEILSARINGIQIPPTIKENILTPAQKDDLKKGLPVELESRTNKEFIVIRLDLNEAKGYKVATGEQARELLQEIKAEPALSQGIENVSRNVKI